MDLSLTKPRQGIPVPLDIPQDLSIKKKHKSDPETNQGRCFKRSDIKGIRDFDFYAYLEATAIKHTPTTYLRTSYLCPADNSSDKLSYKSESWKSYPFSTPTSSPVKSLKPPTPTSSPVKSLQTSTPNSSPVKRRRPRKQAHPKKIVKQNVEWSDADSDSDMSLTESGYAMSSGSFDFREDVSMAESSSSAQLNNYETGTEAWSEFDDGSLQNDDKKTNLPTVLADCDVDDDGDDNDKTSDAKESLSSSEKSDRKFTKFALSLKLKSPKKVGAAPSVMLLNREHRRTLRLFGKEYTTPSGKTYPERKVREKDCSKCRYNCLQNISREQQQAIFDHFWSLNSYAKRLYYYCQSIKEKPAKTMTHTRECSREYTFLVGDERIRVCKGFYLATLDVSDKAVRIAMEKRKKGVSLCDKRGNHPPHNKTKPEDKDRVRRHIEDFLLDHICTKSNSSSSSVDTQVNAAGQEVNITRMHQLYAQECKREGRESVSEDVYRKTFNAEYNLSCIKVL